MPAYFSTGQEDEEHTLALRLRGRFNGAKGQSRHDIEIRISLADPARHNSCTARPPGAEPVAHLARARRSLRRSRGPTQQPDRRTYGGPDRAQRDLSYASAAERAHAPLRRAR